MNFLLDTNVLSEITRPAPEPKVLAWLHAVDEDRTFVSVTAIAEIRRGIALLQDSRRRTALERWLVGDLQSRFSGRLFLIDTIIAERWGDLMAHARQSGFALSVMDGFHAATALVHGCVLVTRNVKDFAALNVPTFNPWTDQ